MELKDFKNNHKTFLAAHEAFSEDMQKFRRYFKDRRLTLVEKNILQARLQIRKSNFEKAIKLLNVVGTNCFIQAYRDCYLGIAYNNFGRSRLALDPLQNSLNTFIEFKDKKMAFEVIHCLCMTFVNLKDVHQLKFHLDLMKKYISNDLFEKSSLLRCQAHYLSMIDEGPEALIKIEKALSFSSPKLDTQKALFLIDKFMVAFKMGSYEDCYKTIEEYKFAKGYTIKANYHFMKVLLDHLTKDKPIYVYKSQMNDAYELELQMNVIKSLSCSDMQDANANWSLLSALNPEIYKEKFNYGGDYNLFSVCLTKHLSEELVIDNAELIGKNLQEKLLYILESATTPVSKEQMVQLLWNEDYSYEGSLKLNRLISRLQSSKNIKIKTYRGSIELIDSDTKKAS
jgi:hypothetical protein